MLCDSVARWQEVVPVAAALRNPTLQDRHWTKLQQELRVMLPVGSAFTLQTLFDLKVTCHACTAMNRALVGSILHGLYAGRPANAISCTELSC